MASGGRTQFLYIYFLNFISIVYYVISQLSACTSDTCILKESINQSINHNDTILGRSGVKLKDKLTYVNPKRRLGIE